MRANIRKILYSSILLIKTRRVSVGDNLTLFCCISFNKIYFPGWVLPVPGVLLDGGTAVGSVGIAFGSTAFCICLSILERADVDPRGIVAVATTHKIKIVAANVQVDFSRKSAVLRIPIDWPADVKFAARPPPFEF
jgi:hypothetical protein